MFYIWIIELLNDHTDNWPDHIEELVHQIMNHKFSYNPKESLYNPKGKRFSDSFRRWFDV